MDAAGGGGGSCDAGEEVGGGGGEGSGGGVEIRIGVHGYFGDDEGSDGGDGGGEGDGVDAVKCTGGRLAGYLFVDEVGEAGGVDGVNGGVNDTAGGPVVGVPEGLGLAEAEAAGAVVEGGGEAVAQLGGWGREEE